MAVPASDRLQDRHTSAVEAEKQVDLPLHGLRPAIAVVELQREVTRV